MNKTTKPVLLRSIGFSVTASIVVALSAHPASAQTTNLVSACSGVSLPRSVVTGIMAPVIGGIVTPVQGRVNGILGALAPLPLVPPLSIDAAGLLAGAAAGAPITLQVLNTNGTVVGPADRCDTQADSFTLRTPAGIAIGGNRITGLGSTGLEAQAGEAGSIAFGNGALTDGSSTGAIAIGTGASVAANAANSVALGTGSVAARGALAAYLAPGSTALQSSAGEFSVGAPGALRQITNVAAGSAPTDAANVGQITGLAEQLTALNDGAVLYDGAARDRVTLAGAGGTTIANVARGVVSATSTEAVNGAQLFEANAGITNLATTINNGAVGTVRYADAATPTLPNGGTPTDELTLVGASGGAAGLHNVRAGIVADGSTDAVNGSQLFAVGTRIDALGGRAVLYDDDTRFRVTMGGVGAPSVTIANVAAGVAPGDAVNVAQLTGVAQQVATLGDGAVTYSDGTKTTVVLAGTGGTTITNVRRGAVTAASTDAINGAQLFETNASITNLATTIGNGAIGPVRYADAATPTTPNGGTATDDLTLVAAGGGAAGLHNVRAGLLAAGSTDAVNGGQLFDVDARIGTLAGRAVQYDDDARNRVTMGGVGAPAVTIANVAAGVAPGDAVNVAQLNGVAQQVATLGENAVTYSDGTKASIVLGGTGGTAITNVRAGALTADSTDAVNGSQLAATNVNVANNTTAIANLTTRVDNGGAGPVRYANAATPTTPNGGTPSNDLTLVGATAAPVGLHNVAAGRIEAGSTDAVTGGQVYNLALTTVNAVSYDTDAAGRRTNRVTLAGGNAGNVALANVAAGTLSATSTEAVNGAQLNATNQNVASVQTTATAALALGQNAVQYDAGRTSVTFNAGGTAATLANVGPGVRATDAANVGQLNAGLANTLAQANGYTDSRLSALDFNLKQVRRNADAATAGALAAAGLPQAYEAGKGMIAIGGGVYGDASAVAFGASKAFGDGHTVAKLGGTYDSRGRVGASGGVGYQF